MSAFSNTNYSMYAIPAFWGMTILPHAYALTVVMGANNGLWNNANPRGSSWKEQINKTCPKDVVQKFERLEAAHANSYENHALFFSAIIVGNLAGLAPSMMNTFAVGYLGMRAAYLLTYAGIKSSALSYARTGIYFASAGTCVWILTKAADVFVKASS